MNKIINENDQDRMTDILEKMDQFKAWDYENKVKANTFKTENH